MTCGIGLPTAPVPNDVNGLRIGTPELVRLGMGPTDMPHLASLIADGLDQQCDHAALATRVTRWRAQFSGVHFTLDAPGECLGGLSRRLCRCHRVQVARRQPPYEDRAAHG